LDRRLGGPQSRSGRGGEEKNSQPLTDLKLTPWSRVFLDKLTVVHLVKKLPTFHGDRRFITVSTPTFYNFITIFICNLSSYGRSYLPKYRKMNS
jgi:hypothetical protein